MFVKYTQINEGAYKYVTKKFNKWYCFA